MTPDPTIRRIILTGTSGTGKTTLLDALRAHGHACIEEPVRKVLTEQLSRDGPALPAKSPEKFVDAVFAQCIADFKYASADFTFYDRGLPDVLAYANRFAIADDGFLDTCQALRYDLVVLLPPWPEIFVNDDVRRASFADYERFQSLIASAYQACGYVPISLPQVGVADRLAQLLKATDKLQ